MLLAIHSELSNSRIHASKVVLLFISDLSSVFNEFPTIVNDHKSCPSTSIWNAELYNQLLEPFSTYHSASKIRRKNLYHTP